jgi:UDP-glucuronate 4-epimerase
MKQRTLITGGAGFIGTRLISDLIDANVEVLGVDSYSDYYAPSMKRARVKDLRIGPYLREGNIEDRSFVAQLISEFSPTVVVNLAAQGGVRASKINPRPYITTNQSGFVNILEECERQRVPKLIYASSSSVYGDGLTPPFNERQPLPSPKSLYAASKISNELVAHHYPNVHTQRVGLRLFTVYGPMGRPDMAIFRILASSILKIPFHLTADLEVARDFTYVDDVARVIRQVVEDASSLQPHEILNVAGSDPRTLGELFKVLDQMGIHIEITQGKADVLDSKITHGSSNLLAKRGYSVPSTNLESGIERTWHWLNSCDVNQIKEWYEST